MVDVDKIRSDREKKHEAFREMLRTKDFIKGIAEADFCSDQEKIERLVGAAYKYKEQKEHYESLWNDALERNSDCRKRNSTCRKLAHEAQARANSLFESNSELRKALAEMSNGESCLHDENLDLRKKVDRLKKKLKKLKKKAKR